MHSRLRYTLRWNGYCKYWSRIRNVCCVVKSTDYRKHVWYARAQLVNCLVYQLGEKKTMEKRQAATTTSDIYTKTRCLWICHTVFHARFYHLTVILFILALIYSTIHTSRLQTLIQPQRNRARTLNKWTSNAFVCVLVSAWTVRKIASKRYENNAKTAKISGKKKEKANAVKETTGWLCVCAFVY